MDFITNKVGANAIRPVGYYVKYNNGSMISEFSDSSDGKPDAIETNFGTIDKHDIAELGLVGMGKKVWFNTNDGIIHMHNPIVKDMTINTYFDYNESHLPILITNNKKNDYTDIIQFKHFYNDLSLSTKQFEGQKTNQHCIGYKYTMLAEPGELNVRVLFKLDVQNKPSELEIRLSPKFDVHGYLFTIVDDNIPLVDKIAIEKGLSQTIIKTVKL